MRTKRLGCAHTVPYPKGKILPTEMESDWGVWVELMIFWYRLDTFHCHNHRRVLVHGKGASFEMAIFHTETVIFWSTFMSRMRWRTSLARNTCIETHWQTSQAYIISCTPHPAHCFDGAIRLLMSCDITKVYGPLLSHVKSITVYNPYCLATTYPPIHLSTYPPIYVPTYLPTYLSICLSVSQCWRSPPLPQAHRSRSQTDESYFSEQVRVPVGVGWARVLWVVVRVGLVGLMDIPRLWPGYSPLSRGCKARISYPHDHWSWSSDPKSWPSSWAQEDSLEPLHPLFGFLGWVGFWLSFMFFWAPGSSVFRGFHMIG